MIFPIMYKYRNCMYTMTIYINLGNIHPQFIITHNFIDNDVIVIREGKKS